MDQNEILGRLRDELAEGGLADSSWEVLRFAIRSAFEFGDFLAHLADADEASPTVEDVAKRISASLDRHYDLKSVVGEVAVRMSDLADDVAYANESTVAGAESFASLREIAAQVVRDTPSTPLRWRVYPSVDELRSEFLVHLGTIRSQVAPTQERVAALLHTARLQMIFLANTLC